LPSPTEFPGIGAWGNSFQCPGIRICINEWIIWFKSVKKRMKSDNWTWWAGRMVKHLSVPFDFDRRMNWLDIEWTIWRMNF
jgi:hypothetical protein